jgi:hypothetical protein
MGVVIEICSRCWCVPALVHIREQSGVFVMDKSDEDAGGGNDGGR